jgi:hypothetical protein
MRIATISLLSLFLCSCSNIKQVDIVGMGISKHVVETEKITGYHLNERNIGASVRLDLDKDISFQTGIYKNSLSTPKRDIWTTYAGFDWSPIKIFNNTECGRITAGPFGGIATGYSDIAYNMDVVPVIGVQAAVHCGPMFVRARAFPSPKVIGVGAIEAGITILKF